MKKKYTQTQCREMWEQLLHSERYSVDIEATIKEIDRIDSLTPWSEVEPNWWLDMIQERKDLRKRLNKT